MTGAPTVPLALGALVNGWGLVGLGAALTAVPIIIHLLNRRRVKVVPWAAMAWLLAAMRRNRRRLQLENWLVLALRVAALLLLGLALARPVLTDSSLAGLAGGKRSVYLVVDNSASTGARREARAVADGVKAEVGLVLDALSSEDVFAVVATNDPRVEASTGRAPAVLVPRTAGAGAIQRAKEAVAALPVRDAPASWPAALELLSRQLAPEDVNRQVVVVTDLTARDWTLGAALERTGEALRAFVRRGARVGFVDAGGPSDRRANLAVAEVELRGDRDPFRGRSVPLAVRVANYGAQAVDGAEVTVEVLGEGRESYRRMRRTGRVEACDPATGRAGLAVVDVDLPADLFLTAGPLRVRVAVGPPAAQPDADALALDSERHEPLEVRERLRVLAWTRPSEKATQPPLAWLRPSFDPVPPDGTRAQVPPVFELAHADGERLFATRLAAAGQRPDLVVLANVVPRDPAVQAALVEYVREGGALLVFVGDAVDPRMWNEPFHRVEPARRLLPLALEPAEAAPRAGDGSQVPFHLDLLTPSPAPWARVFTGPDVRLWLGQHPPQMRARMAFAEPAPTVPTPPPSPSAEPPPAPPAADPSRATPQDVVVRWLEGGSPAMVEGRLGLGRTLWVGTSVDDGWLGLGVPFFLPVLLEESAFHLTRPDEPPRRLVVDEALAAVLPLGATGERLNAPGGAEVPLKRAAAGAAGLRARVEADLTGWVGPWRLSWRPAEGGAEAHAFFAVNVEPEEGSLASADRGALIASAGPEAPVEVVDTYEALTQRVKASREGEIAKLLLAVVLGVLLLETLLAFLLGRRASADEPGTGAPRA